MSLFGKIAKNIANEVKPTVSIDVDGPNITKPSIGFNIQAPVPKIDITAQGHGPSIGINAQSNFQPKGINVDISGQGYGSQGTYPPHGGFGPGGFGPQGNYPPQGGYGSQGAYPPQGPQGGYGPHGGFPPQGNYPPQGGYPPQQDSELINSLNETIKSYEAKLKVSETDYINLKQSSMEERSKLQATIDALNQQLASRDDTFKKMEIDLQNANQTIKRYEGDMNRMRIDLGRIKDLEFQLKGKDDQIFQINNRHEEEKKNLKIQIDTINGQLLASKEQLQNVENLYATIKKYEEFINKMKNDIIQFQASAPPIKISPLPGINFKIH